MGKLICPVCGKEIKLLTGKVKVKDGTVCTPCVKKAGFNTLSLNELQLVEGYTVEQISNLVYPGRNINSLEQSDMPSISSIGPLTFDDGSQIVVYTKGLLSQQFQYSQIINAEILENNVTKQKSGAGGAVLGTVVAGPVGTVVGGLMGRKSKNLCNSIKLEIDLSYSKNGPVFIELINKPIEIGSKEYLRTTQLSRELLSKLQEIISKNEEQHNTTTSTTISVADELLKYKKLLDMNAITQEEFNKAKRKLMGE